MRTSAGAFATDATPAQRGYRWPAEWERHAGTWLAWPHNPETWPGRIDGAISAVVAMVRALAPHEAVAILVDDARMEESARKRLDAGGVDAGARVAFHRVPTNDAWLRDTGPIFVARRAEAECEDDTPRRALVDFGFDAWGGKYEPYDLDDAVPRRLAEALSLPRFAADFVLEGGSVDGNGHGAVLTTESCLLDAKRGGDRSREAMERRLGEWLGATTVLWLGAGIVGDDTDGHVDDVARFVAPGTVVTVVESDSADANCAPLAENLKRLRGMRDQDGKPLAIATLPMPPPFVRDGARTPASYANFYLANDVALVPTFGVPTDTRALAVLRELLAPRDVVGIPCRDLIVGLGALHCMTQQEPE
jgi:agmatine deiminase